MAKEVQSLVCGAKGKLEKTKKKPKKKRQYPTAKRKSKSMA